MRFFAVDLVRNYRRRTALPEPASKLIAVITLVRQNLFGGFEAGHQRNSRFAIGAVPRREQKTYRTAFFIRDGVDFGRATAARPPDGLRTAPFLPLATRWALMIVLSMAFS
jgi:hypothetical protein